MGRIVLVVILTCCLSIGIAQAWDGEGTVLNRSSLPEQWIITTDYLASTGELQVFSNQLGVTIELLRNYVLSTPEGSLQINFVITETEEQAQALYELFLGVHAPENVGLNGCRVMEVLTNNFELVELAQATLGFDLESVETEDSAALKEYVKRWSWSVQDLQTVTDQLHSELEAYKIFLVGESHGISFNQELESGLLEFFVREGGVQNYLLELSPSVVGFLREYIETGNEELLNLVFTAVEGTYFGTVENYRHWRRVHDLYQSLPDENKFTLLGVDVEHQPILSFQYLNHLLGQVENSELLETKLGEIGMVLRGERSVYDSEVREFLAELLAELETEAVQTKLGVLAEEFELVLSNLIVGVDLPTTDAVSRYAIRDRAMYTNFLKQADKHSEAKYFGQWGLNHVYQNEQMGVEWFASFLDKTEVYNDTVFSMVLVYQDSHYMESFSHETLPFDNYLTGTNLLGQLAANNPLLVKLNGPESPFMEELIWNFRQALPLRGVTTDYYQYLLFVPGATPSTPWAVQ